MKKTRSFDRTHMNQIALDFNVLCSGHFNIFFNNNIMLAANDRRITLVTQEAILEEDEQIGKCQEQD